MLLNERADEKTEESAKSDFSVNPSPSSSSRRRHSRRFFRSVSPLENKKMTKHPLTRTNSASLFSLNSCSVYSIFSGSGFRRVSGRWLCWAGRDDVTHFRWLQPAEFGVGCWYMLTACSRLFPEKKFTFPLAFLLFPSVQHMTSGQIDKRIYFSIKRGKICILHVIWFMMYDGLEAPETTYTHTR